MAAGIVLLLIMVIVFILFIRPNRKKEQERREQEIRLNDEFIYDPVTGRKLTLEEAENGIISSEIISQPRIKSKEEIEKYYNEDDREFEYFIIGLIESDLIEVEDINPIITLIEKTNLIQQYLDFGIVELYQYHNSSFIGVIRISYESANGRNRELIIENQLFAITNHQLNFNAPDNYTYEKINDIFFYKSLSKVKQKQGIELINLIKDIHS